MDLAAATLAQSKSTAVIGIGANLGDARTTVQEAAKALAHWPSSTGFRLSRIYCTLPIDSSGPNYINAVAAFQTTLAPLELLDALQALELQHGRERPYRNAPRTLDLDLLLYGAPEHWIALQSPRLTLPHPRLHLRAFVLQPALDLYPDLLLGCHGGANDCLQSLGDQGVRLLESTP
jgi:2-amino-4-hydroxy-6-hydroxymethyldihydropteridine diphosphokinase